MFENIPLTALALKHGGYDWALLAYAVGFGGSLIWFGSSAGVLLTSQFPKARKRLIATGKSMCCIKAAVKSALAGIPVRMAE